MNNSYKIPSRHDQVDIEKCIEMAGGNKFQLAIMAATRARAISRAHKDSGDPKHIYPAITALLEFQDGTLDKEYLKRVK
jgi:DNA-directed RNA polymerase subunit K/omega